MQLLHRPVRKRPAHEPTNAPRHSNVIFLTACTNGRLNLLANEKTHRVLREAWMDYKDWMVGPYVLMPDHLHILVANASPRSAGIHRWVAWWKRLASRELGMNEDHLWQRGIWDSRLRSDDCFADKARYIRENPVRRGLVSSTAEWQYGGWIHELKLRGSFE